MSILPLSLLLLASLRAQQGSPSAPPGPGIASPGGDLRWSIAGTVRDLSRDSAGRILYCTAEGEVGRLGGGTGRVVVGTAAQFPNELRAAVESGPNILAIDVFGNVRVMLGGVPPATPAYTDQFLIDDPSDMIVDGRGSFLITSATPSSGQRAINWIQSNGQDWSYYLVKHQPLALAHDPLTGGILMSDATSGGILRLIQAGSPIHATVALDVATRPGISSAQGDGDLAVTTSGDVYWIAGGSIWLHSRASGITSLYRSGFQQLRGVAIAAATFFSGHDQPWSLFVAEGANPTRIREVGPAGAPAGVVASDQGDPPGKGLSVNVPYGCLCLDITLDQAGRLLLGGTTFGSGQFLKRITTNGTPSITTLASNTDGLVGPIEGVCVAPDHSIYTLARGGTIQRVTTQPLSVTTVFGDPANDITVGKDLALDLDGSFYVAVRDATDNGRILKIGAGNVVTQLLFTEETRGLAARPLGGMYFSQWRNAGFNGTVDLLHFDGPSVETIPGFGMLNYSNDEVRGDGEICVDAFGNLYTICEDDWSLVRYDANLGGIERIGSAYLGHPSGLAIALSTGSSGSTTGWSLFVSESSALWEIPSSPPPASPFVDASLGLVVERTMAGAPHPRHGRPSVLAPSPHPDGLLIGTEGGWLLTLDTRTGAIQAVAGPEQGLSAAIVALATSPDGRRTHVVDAEGRAFDLEGTRLRPYAGAPEPSAALLASARAAPQRAAVLRDPRTGRPRHYALDGWAVWRVLEP